MTEVISSAANPLIKRVRLLGDRRHRRREGAFVVRGVQPVWQAVEAGADIEVLIVAPDLLREPAAGMVAGQEAAGVRVARVSGELFGRIADRDGPAGLAAIVRRRTARLADLTVGPASVFVALHEVANPGNLGTIIRTADAAGAGGVILVGACTDPFDPVAVKASMGAVFSVAIAAVESAGEFLAWAKETGTAVAVTSGSDTGLAQVLARVVAQVLARGRSGTRGCRLRWPSCSAAKGPACPMTCSAPGICGCGYR